MRLETFKITSFVLQSKFAVCIPITIFYYTMSFNNPV